MKLHLTTTAGNIDDVTIKSLIPIEGINSTLWSFAYGTSSQERDWRSCWELTRNRGMKVRVILDSGAFTAWSSGKTVKLEDYAEWAIKISKSFPFDSIRFINLDHIPGKKGLSATADQIKMAASQSLKNADTLRTLGVTPLVEVFHQDEPFELLKIINERRKGGVIALSPRNDVSVQQRELWLKKCLQYCVKEFGKENIPPCHGLAVTSERLLKAFPFFSGDSSTWTQCLQYGKAREIGIKKIPPAKGGDAEKMVNIHALRHNVRKFKRIESDMTSLWKLRGITWDESKIR